MSDHTLNTPDGGNKKGGPCKLLVYSTLPHLAFLIEPALQGLYPCPDLGKATMHRLVVGWVSIQDLTSLLVTHRLPQEIHKVEGLIDLQARKCVHGTRQP